ncbi:MAG: S26 family signal peptidase [Saccharolobus sp.]|uniref:S26 family signal peptidase n=1 Tax=Saccharolobus TaxID=2100760 RepID=UPI001F0E1646|nr:S26 family signal peptidase [Saccharolobus shibatae]MCH4816778.1 S26 family signal peptidase [Saccharolobus shibatae]
MLRKIIVYFMLSLLLGSIIFSLISRYFFGLPYGWNIEATNSMYPLLKPGDLVFVFPLLGKPFPNEIVAYKPPFLDFYVVHEVINVTTNGYITKGINNPTPDPWIVKLSWIKGFVPEIFGQPIIIPYVGNIIALVRGTTGYIAAFIAIFAIYAISEVVDRNQVNLQNKRRSRRKTIDPKTLAIAFLILSFATFMILFSPHIIFTNLMWNSVPNAPFTPRQLNNNLGAVPPYSSIPVTLSVNYRPFLFKIPLIILYSPNLKLQNTSVSNITFLLYTSSPGLHSQVVSIEILPELLPPQILNFLLAINPILPLIGEGIEISTIISVIVYIIVKKLS